jgi:UDP-N-acetylglucosamine--N-acetylmuramyl-(pentapeptide) pyrophosphoryl-undecaprenol N-acetylglucosamine transferase
MSGLIEASGTRRVEPFFEEMALVYQAADFAICRAGAGTLCELARWGSALLVPYPTPRTTTSD